MHTPPCAFEAGDPTWQAELISRDHTGEWYEMTVYNLPSKDTVANIYAVSSQLSHYVHGQMPVPGAIVASVLGSEQTWTLFPAEADAQQQDPSRLQRVGALVANASQLIVFSTEAQWDTNPHNSLGISPQWYPHDQEHFTVRRDRIDHTRVAHNSTSQLTIQHAKSYLIDGLRPGTSQTTRRRTARR
jgi:hypothetical protein